MAEAASGPLHGVLLAAGASRRFGSPKALAKFGHGTLLDHAVGKAKAVLGEHFTVILGAHAATLRSSPALADARVATHDAWLAGMSASLRFGLAQVPAQAPAALIMLVDQPAIDIADLKSLIAAWRARPALAVAAWYADDIGAPCILPRNLFERAAALQGDRGAKPLLRTLEELSRVPMPAAEFDIDTAEDLACANARVAIETTLAQG